MLNACKLYELMNELGIKSIKQLSKETKIAYNTLMYMLSGHDMHVSTMVELSNFFKVPIDYLVNSTYGVLKVSENREEFLNTSSVIEATVLGMLIV